MALSPAKSRKSNFELLRIIAMLMIVAFHCVYKARWDVAAAPLENRLVIDAVTMLGEMGVNLFVLVSGYFLVQGRFSWKKLILLLAEVAFYNYLSLLVLAEFDMGAFISSITIADVMPTMFGKYWFVTAYMLLYLLSPYLGKALRALERDEIVRLLVIMLAIWCLIPTFLALTNEANNTEVFLYYSRFIWMVVLFAIGGFVSLHGRAFRFLQLKARCYVAVAGIIYLALVLFMILVEIHPGFAANLGVHSPRLFWPPNTIAVLSVSLALFMAFERLEMPCLLWVNRLASTTLGVYLLHDGALSGWIWVSLLNTSAYLVSCYLILWILVESLAVFAACSAIDFVRQIPERWLSACIDKVANLRGGANQFV